MYVVLLYRRHVYQVYTTFVLQLYSAYYISTTYVQRNKNTRRILVELYKYVIKRAGGVFWSSGGHILPGTSMHQ